MDSLLLAHLVAFSFAAVVCLVSIPRALRIRHPGTRNGLVVLLGSVVLWSIGYVGYFLAPTETAKIAFYTGGFVFAFVAVAAWFYFCAAYTGRSLRQIPYRNVAVGAFLVFTALKLTNPLHELYFTTSDATEPFSHLAIQHELLYWLLLGLSYAVIAVGFYMLLERFYQTGTDTRPLVAIIGLTVIPTVATVTAVEVSWLLPLMYEPPGVALFAVGLLFIYTQRFETIRLTGGSDKPAIFLDTDGLIRDYNQAAIALFPRMNGTVGEPLDSVTPELAAHLSTDGITTEIVDGEKRFYEISTTAFLSGEIVTGHLMTIADITERERYRQQLELRTTQLELMNRVVRHDIRNDMTVILGWVELLRDHVDAEGEEAISRVVRKANHVVEITETAREFVHALAEEHAIEAHPVDVSQLLEVEILSAQDSNPNAEIRLSGEIPPVSVAATKMLSSVFRNLLENAVRHNDQQVPEITVSVEEGDQRVRVSIADNGPGIPDAQKESIFAKGVKGDRSRGSGIGLYLVETLVTQYGGDVRVSDNEPNGSVFTVELNKAEPPA